MFALSGTAFAAPVVHNFATDPITWDPASGSLSFGPGDQYTVSVSSGMLVTIPSGSDAGTYYKLDNTPDTDFQFEITFAGGASAPCEFLGLVIDVPNRKINADGTNSSGSVDLGVYAGFVMPGEGGTPLDTRNAAASFNSAPLTVGNGTTPEFTLSAFGGNAAFDPDIVILQNIQFTSGTISCVPEPSAFLFLGSLATLGAFGRWRKRHSS